MTPLGPPPKPSSPAVRRRMQQQSRRDTGPEKALRSILHGRGLRYRVDARPLLDWRRRADLVFSKARVAVFVDGCFWHGCPECSPVGQHKSEWWRAKIARNAERDRDTDTRLSEADWTVIRVWEHADMSSAADLVEAAVRQDRG